MNSFKIISVEAKDLFGAMHQVGEHERSYSIRTPDGSLSLRKFTGALDWSLDSIKLEEVYNSLFEDHAFAFKSGKHTYTKNVICVTFKYSYKEFNLAGKNTYIKNGYSYRDCDFKDCVCFKDGELIGIQTGVGVLEPVDPSSLGKNFVFNGECYEQRGNIPTIMDKSELRSYLYQNGFICDGVEYVRYKRSCGSSRVGKCLFVNKALAPAMKEWDKCGLKVSDGDQLDLAGWEAYISLPMSSIIDTIDIPMESILVIDDYDSEFEDTVIAVSEDKNGLVSGPKKAKVTNTIWDGQSLLDSSLFGSYSQKGMILLRNQFFKSCCFNTNLQQFFADNNITDVGQLNGFTYAKRIEDVKMVTTCSSIKYAKFGDFRDWLKTAGSTFGIVKFEKKPHPFNGRLVQAHYQLFNTLQLSYQDAEKVLEPSLKYIGAIRRDPAVLRYHIQYPFDDGSGVWRSMDSKNEIVFRMLGVNDKFAHTKLYYDFRDDVIKSEIRNLKRGHVLVNGNYSTMFGNGLEMLRASINAFDGTSALGVGNIHSLRFPFSTRLLCSRSPHVTVGNILLANNVSNDDIDRYFNLTPEIVCVNAIGENIQQRLNGCDYDSDTILITDDELLVAAAEKNYNSFLVPTCFVSATKIQRKNTDADRADLDVKTSVNKIGEIINLSQYLNSLMWQRLHDGEKTQDVMPLYYDICKLSVLSGIEIDSAKREYTINRVKEIATLKEKYRVYDDTRTVKPMFFKMITLENGYTLSDNIKYKYFDTSMDYLQRVISRFNFREGREQKRTVVPFMDMVKRPDCNLRQGYYYNCKAKIIDTIRAAHEEKRRLFTDYDKLGQDEKNLVWSQVAEIKQDCINAVEEMSTSPATMYLVLKELDNKQYNDVSRFVFEVLFGRPDEVFFQMLKESKEDIYTLAEDPCGEFNYHGFSFKKVPLRAQAQ